MVKLVGAGATTQFEEATPRANLDIRKSAERQSLVKGKGKNQESDSDLSQDSDNDDKRKSTNQKDLKQQTKKKASAKQSATQKLILCTQNCRYNVVKRACRKMGMKCDPDENADWDIYWSDITVPPERISKMRPNQRVNALPNIGSLARKNNLAKHLTRMKKNFKEDYSFFPKTWCLPVDGYDLKNQFMKNKKPKTFIIKPVHMCQGRGIYLVRKFEDIIVEPGE